MDHTSWFGFGESEQVCRPSSSSDFTHASVDRRLPFNFTLKHSTTHALRVKLLYEPNVDLCHPGEYHHFWTVFVPNSQSGQHWRSAKKQRFAKGRWKLWTTKQTMKKARQMARDLKSERGRAVSRTRSAHGTQERSQPPKPEQAKSVVKTLRQNMQWSSDEQREQWRQLLLEARSVLLEEAPDLALVFLPRNTSERSSPCCAGEAPSTKISCWARVESCIAHITCLVCTMPNSPIDTNRYGVRGYGCR